MRLDELFKNLGYLAATIGSQVRDNAFQGVPLEELDLTGAAPEKIALLGPAQVVLSEGEVFRVDVARGPSGEEVLFSLSEGKLGVAGNSAIMNVEPVFALVLAWLILGQAIAPVQVAGALLVVGAVMVLGLRKR